MSDTDRVTSETLLKAIIGQGVDVEKERVWFCDLGSMRFRFNEILASVEKFTKTNSEFECNDVKYSLEILQNVIKGLIEKNLSSGGVAPAENIRASSTPLGTGGQSRARPDNPSRSKNSSSKNPGRSLNNSMRTGNVLNKTPNQEISGNIIQNQGPVIKVNDRTLTSFSGASSYPRSASRSTSKTPPRPSHPAIGRDARRNLTFGDNSSDLKNFENPGYQANRSFSKSGASSAKKLSTQKDQGMLNVNLIDFSTDFSSIAAASLNNDESESQII